MQKLKPGYLLDSIRTGKNNKPKNQGKPWNANELSILEKRYTELLSIYKTKKKSIEILQEEFGRGYFSILNKIDGYQKGKS